MLNPAEELGILPTALGKGWQLQALAQSGMTWRSVLCSHESKTKIANVFARALPELFGTRDLYENCTKY